MNSPLQGKIYLFSYILRKARCLGGSSLMFCKMSVQDIYYGYRVLMLSHEKFSPKIFKLNQVVQNLSNFTSDFKKPVKIVNKDSQRRFVFCMAALKYLPMYQDYACTACSIFVLVVSCGSIVYARTSWTYRYYSIETLFYVYRVIPKLCYSYQYSYFLFYYGTLGLQ